jgi:hypothetical protein
VRVLFSHGVAGLPTDAAAGAGVRKAFTISLLLVVMLGAIAVLLLAANVYTYHRLTAETLIAELRFEPTGDRRYLAYLKTGDRCRERVFPVLGEQWRVDAEFVKWRYWALLLGLDSDYRLDRLEGRYRSAAEQNTAPNIAHDLGGGTALDVVEIARALGPLNFLLDATYGTSTYQDIDPDRVYRVYRTSTGIITRSEPRPAELPRGAALSVDVSAACGGKPSTLQTVATWLDARVVTMLAWAR